LFLVPMVVTPIVVGIQWKFMLNSQMGVITYFARLLGFPVSSWLTHPGGALFWVVAVDVWYYTPIVILLFSAALSAIPGEVKEAARVDGASEWQTVRYVTLPMLKSIAVTALLIRSIGGLRTFDTILVLTDGGPGRVTEVVNLYAYRLGFYYFDMGKASALGWLMLLVAAALVVVYIRLLKATADS
jgi:multiple sugar transport system permease protein